MAIRVWADYEISLIKVVAATSTSFLVGVFPSKTPVEVYGCDVRCVAYLDAVWKVGAKTLDLRDQEVVGR